MAKLHEILARKWPESRWTIKDDDYAQIEWHVAPDPIPTEEEIRAFSDEVDAEIAEARETDRKNSRVQGALAEVLLNIYNILEPIVRGQPIPNAVKQEAQRIKTKLEQLTASEV